MCLANEKMMQNFIKKTEGNKYLSPFLLNAQFVKGKTWALSVLYN